VWRSVLSSRSSARAPAEGRRVRNGRRRYAEALEHFQAMEPRILLTTLQTAGAATQTFSFLDAQNKQIAVTLHGNITAELYGSTNGTSLTDLVPGTNASGGTDIFAVYITASDVNSWIAINGVADAFTGGISALYSGATGNGLPITAPTDAGQVYVGYRDSSGTTIKNIPVLTLSGGSISGAAQNVAQAQGGVSNGSFVAGIYDSGTIGKVLIDGTVTGKVGVGGSVGDFYAGWLVTGDVTTGGQTVPDNFHVGGDLGSLLVRTSVGTQLATITGTTLNYDTGVQIHVNGNIGTVRVGGSFAGSIIADNANVGQSLASQNFVWSDPLTGLVINNNSTRVSTFEQGSIPAPDATDPLANGTFQSPYYVGSLGASDVTINGSLQGTNSRPDPVDYYAVGVMAGQTITVTLSADLAGANLGIFDPDGRLVSTSVAAINGTITATITADRAGAYRIAVGLPGDFDVDGAAGFAPAVTNQNYSLTISGVNSTGIGGISAGADILIEGSGVGVAHGDLGAIVAGGNLLGTTFNDISVSDGNIGAIEGNSVGSLNGQTIGGYPIVTVSGGVGLIHGTSFTAASVTAGDDLQIISSGGDLEGSYVTEKSIGIIRAASITGNSGGTAFALFWADSDDKGGDGIIDLIDVTGDLGSLQFGGPRIRTGAGGDVRYFHVGGQIFQDPSFGTGGTSANGGIVHDPSESVSLIDDSGARVNIGTTPTGQLTTYTYGIYGTGGVAIIKVESTADVNISTFSKNSGANQAAEIGEIVISTSGVPLSNSSGSTGISLPILGTAAAGEVANQVTISGRIPLNLFQLTATGSVLDSFSNTTGGDLLNVSANDIGTLTVTGNIGTTSNTTGAILNQSAVVSNSYPFVQQHIGIVADNIVSIAAGKAVGNIIASGSVGTITANSGGSNDKRTFEGIVGPIVVTGNLGLVNIGEGIADNGQIGFTSEDVSYGAAMAQSGIYVGGALVQVTGKNADIRGDIISNQSIGSINLSNGSIIGSQVAVLTSMDMSSYLFGTTRTLPETADTTSTPIFEIQNISITGNGGIIGSAFEAADIGSVTVAGTGFGILNSAFYTLADGVLGSLNAGGYGLRGDIFNGARIISLKANGKGTTAALSKFSGSVLNSQHGTTDPVTNQTLTAENDLALFMATNGEGDDDLRTGIIGNSQFIGARNLGSVSAFSISNFDPSIDTFNFANSIGTIKVTKNVSNTRLLTGTLENFTVGGDASNLDLEVAGDIGTVNIAGNFNSGLVYGKGSSSNVKAVNVAGNFAGNLIAQDIKSLTVGKGKKKSGGNSNLTGNIQLLGTDGGASVTINSSFSGTLTSAGDLDKLTILGTLDGRVLVNGGIKALSASSVNGAVVTASGDIGTITVKGAITSSVIQAGLSAGADGLFGTGDAGEATSRAEINTIKVGSLNDSVIAAGGDINSLTATQMNDSSVSSGLVIQGQRIQQVLDGSNGLGSPADVQALRSDSVLYFGNFKTVKIGNGAVGAMDADSVLTAGVSPGSNGIFGDPSDASIVPVESGVSKFSSVKVNPAQLGQLLAHDA
jgi:hypothetical protein